MMDNLFTYISALKGNPLKVSVIETWGNESHTEEDGIHTNCRELVVKFSNGVALKQQIEFDHIDVVDDMSCSECWITYEVISAPQDLTIQPRKKIFINHCQEAFWLKVNQSQIDSE